MKQGYDPEQCKVVEVCDKRTPPVSRGDWIRVMSNAQLARVLATKSDCYCRNTEECDQMMDEYGGVPIEKCICCAIDWLREEDDGTLDV